MGKNNALRAAPALLLLAACAGREVTPAVAPSLPPATYLQVTILDGSKSLLAPKTPAAAPGDMPCVLDVRKALDAAPEIREIRARGYAPDSASYHMLVWRGNERLKTALRRVILKRGFDFVMERGSVALRPEHEDKGVAVADITEDVLHELARGN